MSTFHAEQQASAFLLRGHVHHTTDFLITGQQPIAPDRIGSNSLTTAKVADSAVTTDKIQDGAVTIPKLNSQVITFFNDVLPAGVIVVWSGTIDSVPVGWFLCDGNNGTPNLKGRFILGSNPHANRNTSLSTQEVGNTGGEETVTLTVGTMPSHLHTATVSTSGAHSHTTSMESSGAHTHSGSLTGGTHTHGFDRTARTAMEFPNGSSGSASRRRTHRNRHNTVVHRNTSGHSHTVSVQANSGGHTHGSSIKAAGAHNHAAIVENTGSASPHENMPPFFVLAYIQKGHLHS